MVSVRSLTTQIIALCAHLSLEVHGVCEKGSRSGTADKQQAGLPCQPCLAAGPLNMRARGMISGGMTQYAPPSPHC